MRFNYERQVLVAFGTVYVVFFGLVVFLSGWYMSAGNQRLDDNYGDGWCIDGDCTFGRAFWLIWTTVNGATYGEMHPTSWLERAATMSASAIGYLLIPTYGVVLLCVAVGNKRIAMYAPGVLVSGYAICNVLIAILTGILTAVEDDGMKWFCGENECAFNKAFYLVYMTWHGRPYGEVVPTEFGGRFVCAIAAGLGMFFPISIGVILVYLVPHWMEDPMNWSISTRKMSLGLKIEPALGVESMTYPELRRAIAVKDQELKDLMKKLAKVQHDEHGNQMETKPPPPNPPSYVLKSLKVGSSLNKSSVAPSKLIEISPHKQRETAETKVATIGRCSLSNR